ncbi:LysR family transcriptional regulator [Nocardia pseudobrasiliensis]|uniref:DNA-binding transcriptional LysR family regulator n=1 Tax=Nocardia pseudobrasiliensis TaxID=45979 RepID=A0A370HY50_9NOCA|nr:LysR family transcriptional regulator [Nocardia pseudobrasiliensis]RDI62841.1 DNA-binding transcriptional LysR family regulator [Nocardia pseudobrasiliensis]
MIGGSLDDVVLFSVVARSPSLTEAARELGVSVSSVSKRLGRIEARLGVSLMQRSTRRLTLTPEGQRYAEGLARVVTELEELETSLGHQRDDLRGRVHVRSTIGLGRAHIAPLLAEFAARHRDLQIDVELSALALNIAGTRFDIDIHVGALRDSRLVATRLCRNRRVPCAAPDYLAAHGAPREVAELAEHRCLILRENENDYALWRFGTDEDTFAQRVTGGLISNDGDVITRWCLDGHGIIMRSLWQVGPLLRTGALVRVLPDIPTPSADIYAAYAATPRPPQRVLAVLDAVKSALPHRLDMF